MTPRGRSPHVLSLRVFLVLWSLICLSDWAVLNVDGAAGHHHHHHHSKTKRRMPGSSFHHEAIDRGIPQYQPAFQTREEFEVFQARQRIETMSEEERNIERRKSLENEKLCTEQIKGNGEPHCYIPGLHVSLMFAEGLTFCVNCMDAHETGSLIDIWDAHYAPVKYHVDGRIAVAVPNDGRDRIINGHQVKDHLTLVFRGGGVTLLDKALRVQEAGASAVIIVDEVEGGCDENFDCGPLMGQRPSDRLSQGFAHQDLATEWKKIHVPVVLIRYPEAQKLLKWLNVGTITLPEGGGDHLVIQEPSAKSRRRR